MNAKEWGRIPQGYQLGGRHTDDAEQLAQTLIHRLRESFPANEVPQDLLERAGSLLLIGQAFEGAADSLCRDIESALEGGSKPDA